MRAMILVPVNQSMYFLFKLSAKQGSYKFLFLNVLVMTQPRIVIASPAPEAEPSWEIIYKRSTVLKTVNPVEDAWTIIRKASDVKELEYTWRPLAIDNGGVLCLCRKKVSLNIYWVEKI